MNYIKIEYNEPSSVSDPDPILADASRNYCPDIEVKKTEINDFSC